MSNNKSTHREPLFHISKRTDAPKWLSAVCKAGVIVLALIVCAIICTIISPGSFGTFFKELFNGTFGTPRRIVNLFEAVAILLCISLAVTPAFKMKFWNIGAEGQVLMGALMCVVCMKYLGGVVNDGLLIIIMMLASIVGGAVWAVIPALFKAKWNTNETLFTLMMNYIAMGLISYSINEWVKSGSGKLDPIRYGRFPRIGNMPYIPTIIIVAVVTALCFVYLRYSKHGYELSVVGESVNTARYIGINVKKVIIRTMVLSGALCGIAGWLIVGDSTYTISTTIVGGRGFTAILVSWLAHFDPIMMAGASFLVAFLDQGSAQVASALDMPGAFPDIITSVFFFFVIASEFLVNYKIKIKLPDKVKALLNGKGKGGKKAEVAVSAEVEEVAE